MQTNNLKNPAQLCNVHARPRAASSCTIPQQASALRIFCFFPLSTAYKGTESPESPRKEAGAGLGAWARLEVLRVALLCANLRCSLGAFPAASDSREEEDAQAIPLGAAGTALRLVLTHNANAAAAIVMAEVLGLLLPPMASSRPLLLLLLLSLTVVGLVRTEPSVAATGDGPAPGKIGRRRMNGMLWSKGGPGGGGEWRGFGLARPPGLGSQPSVIAQGGWHGLERGPGGGRGLS